MNEIDILNKIPKKKDLAKKARYQSVTFQLKEEEHKYLKNFCILHDISQSALVREVLINFLEELDKNVKEELKKNDD